MCKARDIYKTAFNRQDAVKRQIAGIKLQKPGFFAPQGRLVKPIHVKLGMANGHFGPLGCAKFYLNRHKWVGMRPQNIKNFHFLKPISRICRGFYAPSNPTLVFQIWHDSLHKLRRYCWETARVRQLGQIFPCTL